MRNFKATAPVEGGSKKLDTPIIPAGFHPVRLYSIVHLGTQYNSHYKKWQEEYEFVFEFPGQRHVFYEGEEARPKVESYRCTASMHAEANLRKNIVQGGLGRVLTDQEAENFDIYDMAGENGEYYIANIQHKVKPNGTYANIVSIAPFQEAFAAQVQDMSPHNDLHLYYLPAHGFESREFAMLPEFRQEMIKSSSEGQKHAQSGGRFAERSDFEDQDTGAAKGPAPQQAASPASSAPSPQPPAPQVQANTGPRKEWLNQDFTYEQMVASGWTDEALVQHGYMKIVNPAPPTPAPQAPQAQQAPPAPSMPSYTDSDDSDLDDVPM